MMRTLFYRNEGLLSERETQEIVDILIKQASAKPLKDHLKSFDELYFTHRMHENNHSITLTAQKTGVARETLSRKWIIIHKNKNFIK